MLEVKACATRNRAQNYPQIIFEIFVLRIATKNVEIVIILKIILETILIRRQSKGFGSDIYHRIIATEKKQLEHDDNELSLNNSVRETQRDKRDAHCLDWSYG